MTEELGMYAMHEMQPGFVKIGDYTLCTQSQGKIWIQRKDGEGAEFNETKFGDAVKAFYEANF